MKDKKYHVLAGLLVAALVGLPCYLESLNLFAGLWSAIVSGIIAGGVKEYCDLRTDGNKWDWIDFGCHLHRCGTGRIVHRGYALREGLNHVE